MRLLIEDLKRRKPFKVGVTYGVLAVLLLLAADRALPVFGAPAWALNLMIASLFIAFPFVVILAWALTAEPPEGLRVGTRVPSRLPLPTRNPPGTPGGLRGRGVDE